MLNTKKSRLEDFYNEYFISDDLEISLENESLLQPSPLKDVDSFTTYEITDELLTDKGKT